MQWPSASERQQRQQLHWQLLMLLQPQQGSLLAPTRLLMVSLHLARCVLHAVLVQNRAWHVAKFRFAPKSC